MSPDCLDRYEFAADFPAVLDSGSRISGRVEPVQGHPLRNAVSHAE